MEYSYDIIVVGAGHAGCEAAATAANLGSKVLLITMDMTKFAQMSCNPAIGGIAKGQIVREIDALGGYTGIITDKTTIHFRMLNRSKGPAMWSPRAQCDRVRFSMEWRAALDSIKNLDLWQDAVTSLIIEDNVVKGVNTKFGLCIFAKSVVITAGTFLTGLIHVGRNQISGGRVSEPASFGITEQLINAGIVSGRMKTGTPARLDGRTIDFSKMAEQKGEEDFSKFSYLPGSNKVLPQRSCYVTHTNQEVHNILKTGFEDSPLYNGTIQSIGPRYCPSIETKIITFADKLQHQLFIEPEGIDIVEYYLNGFSSSLPLDVQYNAIRKIEGLENVKIYRPGYAIEYDYFPPVQLKFTLESKILKNLFFAGQVNGTTGYEEAAAQGMMAGINAHQNVNNLPDFILRRDEAYIGVLIDDLINKGVDEPYRMFTSRAEYRVLLRQDNADIRLTEKAYKLGLVKEDRYAYFKQKIETVTELQKFIKNLSIKPNEVNEYLESKGESVITQQLKLESILLRPNISISEIANYVEPLKAKLDEISLFKDEIIEEVEIQIKYSGYIEREQIIADKLTRLEYIELNENFDYSKLLSLSTEARQKLSSQKPRTIGQAARISGVSPSDINVLLVYLGR